MEQTALSPSAGLAACLRLPLYDDPPGLRQASSTFGLKASSDGRPGRRGGNAMLRHVKSVRQQLDQSILGDSSIPGLRSLATPYDTKSPVTRQAVAPSRSDPPLLLPCEQRAGLEFKKQHNLSRDLVDMLSAWAGASRKSNLQPRAQLGDV